MRTYVRVLTYFRMYYVRMYVSTYVLVNLMYVRTAVVDVKASVNQLEGQLLRDTMSNSEGFIILSQVRNDYEFR